MKKKRVLVVAAFLHLMLCVLFLISSLVSYYSYSAPEKEALDFVLNKGIYFVFCFFSVIAVINATVLYLSSRSVLLCKETNRKKSSALIFSLIATIVFYLFFVLSLTVNKDELFVFLVIWLVCELCSGVLLVLPTKKNN